MKKVIFIGTIVLGASLLVVSTALALPSNKGTVKAEAVSPAINNGQVVAPPPFVFQLPEDKLTKVIFIRYTPGKAPLCDNDGICEKGENAKKCPNDCGGTPEPSPCYGFLSGAHPKWNWVEDYYYSTTNLGLAATQAVSIWEGATSGDIFGQGLAGSFPWGKYDYNNAISFGNYSDPNVIAVTAIWFKAKNIYEYDIMFDTDYFPAGQEANYDLESVTLHEMGHAAGLDDLYDSVCVDQVMYGYYQGALTTLGSGDITGIQTLYGN